MAQSFLALEVVVERSFGDVGGRENSIDPSALEPVSVNLAKRCLQQALSRALRIAQPCSPALQLLRRQQHTNQYVCGLHRKSRGCRPIRVLTTSCQIGSEIGESSRGQISFYATYLPGYHAAIVLHSVMLWSIRGDEGQNGETGHRFEARRMRPSAKTGHPDLDLSHSRFCWARELG